VGFAELPSTAAWRHRDARDGFEVVFLRRTESGYRLEGHTAAVEDHDAWAVRYSILLDPSSRTRSAWVAGRSATGARQLALETSGEGTWQVNGETAPLVDGCMDIDLEASALTNALPVRRLRLEVGQEAEAPAAYVRAPDLGVERLAQHYLRLEDQAEGQRYRYTAPAFGFECELAYDRSGLVLNYPGIAVRVA